MTTTTTLTACPAWCTLEPGHDWDSEPLNDAGGLVRGHSGPRFGRFISCGSEEIVHTPLGETRSLTLAIVSDTDTTTFTSNGLRDLAADLVAAAEWIEANQ